MLLLFFVGCEISIVNTARCEYRRVIKTRGRTNKVTFGIDFIAARGTRFGEGRGSRADIRARYR